MHAFHMSLVAYFWNALNQNKGADQRLSHNAAQIPYLDNSNWTIFLRNYQLLLKGE